MFVRSAAALAATLLALWVGTAAAHEGHDHGAEAPAAPAATAPRGASSTDALELVAIARDGRVTVFLDRVATNEPVTDAIIEAQTPEGTKPVPPLPDGSYGFDAHWSAHAGAYEVVFTVAAEGTSDVFPVTLDVPAPPPEPPGPVVAAWQSGLAVAHDFGQHLTRPDPLLLVTGGAGFLLGALVMGLARRRSAPLLVLALVLALAPALAPRAFAHEGHGDEGHGRPMQAPHGHEGHDHANATPMALPVGQDQARRLPDGGVFVPKPTQRVLAIRTAVTASDRYSRTTELPGRIIPDPNASGVAQSSVGGRLSPPESGRFPRLGTRVKKGEVLATVTPPVQAVDVSDMRQRQGELDQQIAIIERRVERYRRLAPGGAVSQVQLDDALAELKGLQDRRTALDNIRQQPETLIAPVDGVIAEANAVAGQMASPGAQIFQIVDPSRLWVEALSFDALARQSGAEQGSGGQGTAGRADATARLADGRRLSLAFMGAGLADRSQAVPMHFAISDAPPELRTGQFVTVLAATEAEETGLALPRLAVVRGANGQSLVYEHVAPERFEAREVRIEPLDADRVLVASGLAAGMRVVTQGAELLNQVR